jgi:head-tail adaptor
MTWGVLLPQQTGVFPDLVTIQVSTPTRDSFGEVIEAWSDVPGLADLACRITVPRLSEAMISTERRYPDRTQIVSQHLVAIPQYLPEITTAHRVLIDDVPWGIRGVHTNQLVSVTRILLEQAVL